MGLFDFISGQFIDVIDWVDSTNNTMVYRFPRAGNEIKYGAKLTVRESQVAIFVNEGVIADVLAPGIYQLETKNLPIMTTLQHWDHGFNSPFKAEVYFLNTKRFTNLRWGTKNPIMLRDSVFNMVRIRAFGTYEIRIKDPKTFMTEIVGTDGHFEVEEVESQITNIILSKFTSALSQNTTSILDLAANYEQFGEFMREKVSPYLLEYGLELTRMFVENISLPQEVEQAMDRRTSREVAGDLNQHMQYQVAEGMAHNTQQSMMGDMIGMSMGMAMGNQMAQQMTHQMGGNMGYPQQGYPQQGYPQQGYPQQGYQNNPMAQPYGTPPPMGTPPPQPSVMYHVAMGGETRGPYDMMSIQQMIQQGSLTRETMLWREGMAGWDVAERVLPNYFPPRMPQ